MTKLATLELYQRTATGGADAPRDKTRIYIYGSTTEWPGLELYLKKTHYAVGAYRGFMVVNHPELMAGSWEDCVADFKNAVEVKLEKMGLIEESKYGAYFWRAA